MARERAIRAAVPGREAFRRETLLYARPGTYTVTHGPARRVAGPVAPRRPQSGGRGPDGAPLPPAPTAHHLEAPTAHCVDAPTAHRLEARAAHDEGAPAAHDAGAPSRQARRRP